MKGVYAAQLVLRRDLAVADDINIDLIERRISDLQNPLARGIVGIVDHGFEPPGGATAAAAERPAVARPWLRGLPDIRELQRGSRILQIMHMIIEIQPPERVV